MANQLHNIAGSLAGYESINVALTDFMHCYIILHV